MVIYRTIAVTHAIWGGGVTAWPHRGVGPVSPARWYHSPLAASEATLMLRASPLCGPYVREKAL